MALLTAILSDSLPCLICYHDARCYTYTHSAFWSFWLYGKIQTYPIPKRYRQFFSWIPHDQIPWYLSLLVKRASVTRRTNHLFYISLRRLWWITPLAYLVTWAFRPIGCKHFAYVILHACSTLVGRDGIEPPQARQCVRIPYGITCLLALGRERAIVCVESIWSRVCTHPHTPACHLSQAIDCRRGSSLPCVSGCRHCLQNP